MKTLMRLKDLIEALHALDPHLSIKFETECPVGGFSSYRGYYDQLAMCRGNGPTTVGEVLQKARECDGKTFQGWKGGDFVMGLDTKVWVSDLGTCESLRPYDIVVEDGVAVIKLVLSEEW